MIGGFPIAYSPIAGTTIPVKGGVANWFIGESATNRFDTSDSCNSFALGGNTVDPSYPLQLLTYILEDEAPTLVYDRENSFGGSSATVSPSLYVFVEDPIDRYNQFTVDQSSNSIELTV